MERIKKPPLVGGYFFPHCKDLNRDERARQLDFPPPISDIKAAQSLGKIYTIDNGETIDWSDNNPETIRKQLKLIEKAGFDFIAIDTYVGYKDGKPYTELTAPLDVIAQEIKGTKLKFCNVMCLKLPRAVLPIDPGYIEEGRSFDSTHLTLNKIIEFSARYWTHDNYLKDEDNRPVLAIYGLTAPVLRKFRESISQSTIGHHLKVAGKRSAEIEPYVVGIADIPFMVPVLDNEGFDLVTTMCGLPNFIHQEEIPKELLEILPGNKTRKSKNPLKLLKQRISEWFMLKDILKQADFIPSVTLGFDATPRSKYPNNKSKHGYPNTPKIKEIREREVERQFEAIRIYLNTLAQSLPFLFVYAINEIGEGATIYPKVKKKNNKLFIEDNIISCLKNCIDNFKRALGN